MPFAYQGPGDLGITRQCRVNVKRFNGEPLRSTRFAFIVVMFPIFEVYEHLEPIKLLARLGGNV